MLPVPLTMVEGWLAELKGGKYKPVTRICVQKVKAKLLQYDLAVMNSVDLEGSGKFSTVPFGQASKPVELKNLKGCTWSRNLSQFSAEGSVTLTNVKSLPVGVLSDSGEFDRPGYYTYQRGESEEGNGRWGHSKTEFTGLIMPDRMIHIYQGYGTDPFSVPEEDPYLVKTFTGLIDSVVLNSDKTLTINFRDLGRVLMDTIYWPDVVPEAQFEKPWVTYNWRAGEPIPRTETSGKWVRPKYDTDSNKPYVGKGFSDGNGRAYVQKNGGVNGHLGKHAFDSSSGSYFLSVGNHKRWSSAFEYVQGEFEQGSVSKVKVKAYGGPYTMYISLGKDGDWHGSSKIPYKSRAVDTNADIKFVKRVKIKKGETKTIALPKVYEADKIRITMTDLWDSNIGSYQYRAGIADVSVFKSTEKEYLTPTLEWYGNMEDYTGLIAWILAWGGFFWPRDASGFSYVTHSNGNKINYVHSPADLKYPNGRPALPHGRIWGDLMWTGTSPKSPIGFEQFDKQPLSDCLNRIKEIIGFNLFVDETGGAVWRIPNIYKLGNYISGATGGANVGRTDSYVTIDEKTTLLGLATTVSSKNVREKVFVANSNGEFGATVHGYDPAGANFRRYGGWTDTNFETLEEVEAMASLIALRQFMTYRQSTITIAANPAIQIDDQVKIYEKVTSESYFHYVTGIQSDWDAASGKWTYNLNTQWLGTDPDENNFEPNESWVVSKEDLPESTKKFLKGLGQL